MDLEFTEEASNDIEHIQRFLIAAEAANHQQIVGDIVSSADRLLTFPRLGVKVSAANNPDLIRDYYYKTFVLRYLLTPARIYILRVWHQRENERNT